MSDAPDAPVVNPPLSVQSGMSVATDKRGRKLLIREMDPADQLDLFEAAGKNNGNSNWVGLALLACSVIGIDDVPVQMPKDPAEVKALARRLGSDGIDCVAETLNGRPKTGGDVVATAKN